MPAAALGPRGHAKGPLPGAGPYRVLARTGSREIARYLLEHGAAMTIYAAAMLGDLDLVKAILIAQPDAHQHPGAHGIPLLVHAQQGGDASAEVVAFLLALG